MNAMHAVSHREGPWARTRWWRRTLDLRARALWLSRFSVCVSGCLSASGYHLIYLQKQGVCPPLRRTGPYKTTLFKNLCLLILSSRVWRYL